jgi:putative ABC transport system permease protein
MIVFNLLLRLYPRAFRDAFGDEMRRLFVDQLHTARNQGLRATAALWMRTVSGMTTAAWRERRDMLPMESPLKAAFYACAAAAEAIVTDLRLTTRMLVARPLFTMIVIAAISIGVGGVATIFSGLNALVLRPLPGVTDGNRLVLIDRRTPDYSEGVSASVRFYGHLVEHARSLSAVAVWSRVPLTMVVGQDAYGLSGNIISDNYFDVLGVRPALGRFFDIGDRRGNDTSIVLSHAIWMSRFQGDRGIVGRSIPVNGRPYHIIGVAPAMFRGVFTPLKVDAWVSLAAQPHVHPQRDLADQPWLWAFGRLRHGIDSAPARSELSTLAAGWATAGGDQFVRYTSIRLTPLTGLPDDARQALMGFGAVLLGAAALVLIIAAANVSTLLAMRATARRREMGIRTALGAGRGRLVRQLLTETLALFLAGGIGGTLVAVAGTSALERLPVPSDQGLSLELSPDYRVLLLSVAVSLAAGLVFGIVPALRSASRNPVSLLRSSSTGASRRMLTTKSLIVAQMACSLVLLTTAGLFVRALAAGASIDPGFDASRVALATFNTQSFGYDAERGRAFYVALRQRLEATPSVEAVTYADRIPLTMSNSGATVSIDGDAGQQRTRMRVEVGIVDSGYFETLGIRLLAGREFTSTDVARGNAVAIVNETFARRAWPDASPAAAVGRTYLAGERPVTIVGVAGDSKYSTLSEPATPFVYRPQAQLWGAGQTLFVRVNGDPTAGARIVHEAVASIDPLLPRPAVTTLTREASMALLPQRVAAVITAVLGIAGVVLAAIGLYGLVSYGVTLRLREIGVRMALGASRGSVVQMVLGQGLWLSAMGAALGLVASAVATRLVRAYLLNVSALDAAAFTGGVVVLLAVSVLAAIVPARRAGSADPVTVLRAE